MKTCKINDINKYLSVEAEYPKELLIIKNNLEEYIKTIAPTINFKLDMRFNLFSDGENYAVAFDEMALLEPIRCLLDIHSKTEKEESNIISCIPSSIEELKKVSSAEELSRKFPTLFSIFTKKQQNIQTSVFLEYFYKNIKPSKTAENLKYKKLHVCGINKSTHVDNLSQSGTFSLSSFISAYSSELEKIYEYLGYLMLMIKNSVVSRQYLVSLDEGKILGTIASLKAAHLKRAKGLR